MVLIRAIGTAQYAALKGRLLDFCEKKGLRHKAVIEIRKLRQQLTNEINLIIPNLNLIIDPKYVLLFTINVFILNTFRIHTEFV